MRMEVFFYCCQAIWILTKVFVTYEILNAVASPKWPGRTEKLFQVLLAALLMIAELVNIPMSGAVFSNGVLLTAVLSFATCALLLYRIGWLKCFQISYCFWAGLALADFLLQLILYLILNDSGFESGLFIQISYARGVYLLATSVALFALRKYIIRLFRDYLCRTGLTRKRGLAVSVVLLLLIIYFQRIYLNILTEYYIEMWWLLALVSVLLLFAFYIHIMLRDAREKARLQQIQIEMQKQNYAEVMKAYESRRILIHDIKNHMLMLRNMAEQQEHQKIIEYIDGMYGELHGIGNESWSHCAIIDTILNVKKQEAEEAGIQFAIESDNLAEISLSDRELCALFSNLLDNALEANQKGPAEAKKWVRLRCLRKGDMLVLLMCNPLFEKVRLVEGIPQTTKEKKEIHGLGMPSVRKVVDVHGGSMEITVKADEFQTDIYLKAFGN